MTGPLNIYALRKTHNFTPLYLTQLSLSLNKHVTDVPYSIYINLDSSTAAGATLYVKE